MSRRSRLDDYKALLAKYPADMPMTKIAAAEGINAGTLCNYVRDHNLRPALRVEATVHPVVKKLLNSAPPQKILANNATLWSIRNWKSGRRTPTMAKFLDVCTANGLTVDVVETSILDDLMKRINVLRQQDITGPEACAEMSDMILDLIESENA